MTETATFRKNSWGQEFIVGRFKKFRNVFMRSDETRKICENRLQCSAAEFLTLSGFLSFPFSYLCSLQSELILMCNYFNYNS